MESSCQEQNSEQYTMSQVPLMIRHFVFTPCLQEFRPTNGQVFEMQDIKIYIKNTFCLYEALEEIFHCEIW